MATVKGLIAAKRARIEARVGSESDLTDDLIDDLGRLHLAEGDTSGSGPTVVDAASIGSGIDNSAELLAIKNTLTAILGELVNSKAFADIVVQDSAGTPFIRRDEIDQTTGLNAPKIENFDGTPGFPVGVLVPIKNGGDSVIEDQYYAKAAGPGFGIGDSLSSLKIVDTARTVTLLGWFNITTQLSIAPPLPASIKGYEDLVEELISKLVSQLPATLGAKTASLSLAVALATDTVLPLPTGAATALNQEEEILALETLNTTLELAATENTLRVTRDLIETIEQNTLIPNIRPLTAATDTVAIDAPTLATKANQEAANLDLATIADSVANAPTFTQQDTANTTLASIAGSAASSATVALQGVMIDTLDLILVELSKQKEFEDLIVQDEAGAVFIRREILDVNSNQRTILLENFDGTVGIPTGSTTTVKQIKSNNIVTRNYYAKAAGSGFAIGDSLATMQIVNGETNAVTMLGWFNVTQQTSIAAPATSAISGYEDRIEELLTSLVGSLPGLGVKTAAESLSVALASDSVLPLPTDAATESTLVQLLESLGTLGDISFPASAFDEATDKGLFRLIAKLITETSAAEIAALGEALEIDLIGSPADFGSLKSVIRGAWYDQQNILGSTGDVTTDGIFAAGTIKMLLRALGTLLINGEQVSALVDQNSGQRAAILPPTTRATSEPALVVAISPDTPLELSALPGNVEADIAAIRANTARISQYEFNLAQTTAGLVFLVRTDGVTGTTTNINIATGLAFTPGSIEMSDPIVSGGGGGTTKQIQTNEFVAKTTVAGQWVVEDILTRIMIVDTSNNTVSTPILQNAAGALLTAVPLLGTDVEDTDRTQLALLKSLNTKLPALGAATTALSTPVNIASDQILQMALADRHITGAAFAHPGGVNILLTTTGTLASLDLTGYRSFSIQVSSTNNIANQFVLEGSNDNTNFVPAPFADQANPTTVITGNVTYSQTPVTYVGRRNFRYLRLRNLSSILAGTVQAITTLSPLDVVLPITVGITPNSLVGAQLAAGSSVVDLSVILPSAPAGNSASAPFTPSWGTAISFTYQVIMSVAGSNLLLSVQESNNGQVWTDLYTWPTLASATANAVLSDTSPVFANTSKFYRFFYSSTVNGGGTWSLNFSHNQLNHAPNILADARIDTALSLNNGISNSLNVFGRGVASFALSGAWSGTCQVQVTADGIAWFTLTTNTAVYNPVAKAFINNGNITANGIYEINCGGFRAVRLVSTGGGTGTATAIIRATATSSIVAIEGQVNVTVNNTSLTTRNETSQLNLDQSATITSSNTSGTFFQSWGTSRVFEINITAITATTVYSVEIQEAVGTGWRTVYKFAPISSVGVLRSPLLPNTANYRYVETLTGTALSVTRTTTRIQSNLQASVALYPIQLGGFNFSDLSLSGRVRTITANNNGASKLFLQIHDKATALVTGDVPNGRVYPIAPGGVVALAVADLGEFGSILGANPRLAISTAFSTWVSPVGVGTPNQTFSLHAEVI